MDIAFNKYAPSRRDSGRSSQSLNYLSLAPLTTRMPLSDIEPSSDPTQHVYYSQARSAPPTPSTFDPNGRSRSNTLVKTAKPSRSGISTPGGTRSRNSCSKNDQSSQLSTGYDAIDTNWFLRASMAMSSSAREAKGQTWLVSRASSTSLTLLHEEEYNELNSYNSRKENNCKRSSRKGSIVGEDDQYFPRSSQRNLGVSRPTSGAVSRYGSRIHSRSASTTQLWIPPTVADCESYFDRKDSATDDYFAEPDFVNIEEDIYFDREQEEATIRELARSNSQGFGGWIQKKLGWSLFTTDENDDDDDDDDDDGDYKIENDDESEIEIEEKKYDESFHLNDDTKCSTTLNSITDLSNFKIPPPPKDDEVNLWQDAAWILSVAAQAMFQ